MNLQFNYAARSDVGYVRAGKDNQDGGYAGPHLLVVADGMGGAAGGEIASSVAITNLMHLDEVQSADTLVDSLRSSLEDAHHELQEISAQNPELSGLGTTCVAILRAGNKLAMAHIGDSRAYVLHEGRLIQVTRDHSFVQMLVDQGRITQDEAEHHPKRNVIMRSLGDGEDALEIDVSVRTAQVGDRWLLCSDGLSGVVSRETLEETLLASETPAAAAEELINLTLKAGAPDNVTVVVCDIVSTDDLVDVAEMGPDTVPQIVGSVSPQAQVRKPLSPAAKAAELNKKAGVGATSTDSLDESGGDEEEKKPRILRGLIILLLIAGIIGFGSWGGYAWTQQQYYVGVSRNQVAIYQGVPWNLGFKLSHVVEVTGPSLDDLSVAQKDAVTAGVPMKSLARARSYVAERILVPNATSGSGASGDSTSNGGTVTKPLTITPAPANSTPATPANPASGSSSAGQNNGGK